jgi:hypothetical protein
MPRPFKSHLPFRLPHQTHYAFLVCSISISFTYGIIIDRKMFDTVLLRSWWQLYASIYNTVQQIWGRILLREQKYVYIVEFAMHNIKLALKLRDWLWFKNIVIIRMWNVWKQDITVNLHELNEAPFRLSLVLNFQSIPLHRPAVIGWHGSTSFALVSVLHRWDVLVKTAPQLTGKEPKYERRKYILSGTQPSFS